MAIRCVDGEINDAEVVSWDAPPLRVSVALGCEQVRAVFRGSPLTRGIAMLELNRAQFEKLFPQRSRRKNAATLRRWAGRIRGERAREKLAKASWHQLRAAASHTDEDAQITAALVWILGIDRKHAGVRAVQARRAATIL